MKKRFFTVFAALFCVVLLAGCNEEAKLAKATPKEADAMAREFINLLNKKSPDKAEKLIEPTIRAEAKPKLTALVDLLSKDTPKEVKIIGVRVRKKDAQKLIQLNYQVYYEKAWVVATLAIIEGPKERYIFSVRMDPLKAPLEQLYAFKLFGGSLVHYLVLVFSVIVPLFILYTLMQCVRNVSGKIKWVWIPFIALGFVTFHLDWTTGRVFLQPLSALIFGVIYMKQKYGPLIISVALPIGAIAFTVTQLLKSKKSSAPALS